MSVINNLINLLLFVFSSVVSLDWFWYLIIAFIVIVLSVDFINYVRKGSY